MMQTIWARSKRNSLIWKLIMHHYAKSKTGHGKLKLVDYYSCSSTETNAFVACRINSWKKMWIFLLVEKSRTKDGWYKYSENNRSQNNKDMQVTKPKYKVCWTDRFKVHCGAVQVNIAWEGGIKKMLLHTLSCFSTEMWLINNFASDVGGDRLIESLVTHTDWVTEAVTRGRRLSSDELWKAEWKTWLSSLNTVGQN